MTSNEDKSWNVPDVATENLIVFTSRVHCRTYFPLRLLFLIDLKGSSTMQEKENNTANIKSKFNRNCAVPLYPELRRMWLIKIEREENKQFKASTDYIIKAKSCINKTWAIIRLYNNFSVITLAFESYLLHQPRSSFKAERSQIKIYSNIFVNVFDRATKLTVVW
jgi:hypothetical protein